MPLRCAAGHRSSEPDYCSVCGLPLAPSPPLTSPPPLAPPAPRCCPLCRFDLAGSDASCPLCGYPLALPPLPLLPRSPTAFRVEVSVDPSLDTEPDPDRPCPPPRPPLSCTLDLPESSVGRADAVPPPVLPLDDPGVSRRHAAFLVEHGALWILDLGSTNGTQVNGVSIQPRVRTALQVGDQVTLGRWTRIEVK